MTGVEDGDRPADEPLELVFWWLGEDAQAALDDDTEEVLDASPPRRRRRRENRSLS